MGIYASEVSISAEKIQEFPQNLLLDKQLSSSTVMKQYCALSKVMEEVKQSLTHTYFEYGVYRTN